jgi:hypothetical protein
LSEARQLQLDRRWLPVREAADSTGISESSLRRWARTGRIETEHAGGRTLVDLDQVRRVRSTRARTPRLAVAPDGSVTTMQLLAALAVAAQRRVDALEAEADRLSTRVRELESWISGSARFDEVEHVQLGRLLALESAEREERRRPLVSLRAALLFMYAAAALGFAVLLVTGV